MEPDESIIQELDAELDHVLLAVMGSTDFYHLFKFGLLSFCRTFNKILWEKEIIDKGPF